jgi:DNA-directed RNA polymerase subunit RPC12/RpoP
MPDRCSSCGDVLEDDAEDRVICADCKDMMEQEDPPVPEDMTPDAEVECGTDPLSEADDDEDDEEDDEDDEEDL